jgi:aconitate hydratase
MQRNLTQKIISDHLREGAMEPGESIALEIDQTLTQDATGTMAFLQWEAMGLERVRTELSVSYVDHNTLQMGFRNADDHRYLRTVAAASGVVFSPPGTGICHQLHLENFAAPGKTLLGSDSHTPTAGGVGSLAIGAGGLSVALAMAGEPYSLPMPRVVRVRLHGSLTGWATAKDVILEILRQLTVKGGVGAVLEYSGAGVEALSVPERATITNMGAELGATSSIFPSDGQTREFLRLMGREQDFQLLEADPGASYDQTLELDLGEIVPMAACPHMPDKVVPVAELAGMEVDQVAIGSCTNSSYADLKAAARIVSGHRVHPATEVLLAPGSRQVLSLLSRDNDVQTFLDSGVRILECACGPCIGMGGSPVSKGVSLRTFNRNFEGRSGTQDASVYLVSPVTAAMAALHGRVTEPATWGAPVERPRLPSEAPSGRSHFLFPSDDPQPGPVLRGPNIVPLEPFQELPERLEATVLIKVGDHITTDHILPGGPQVTALRSNVPEISKHVFSRMDPEFAARAAEADRGVVVGGENYGQGSSREHAALAPRHLGVTVVLAKSFARIHRANLVNFGILPLSFEDPADHDRITPGQQLSLDRRDLTPGGRVELQLDGGSRIGAWNDLSASELGIVRSGGMLNAVRARQTRQ